MSKGHFWPDVNVPALVQDHERTRALISDDTYMNFHVSLPTSELTMLEVSSHYGSFVPDPQTLKYNMLWGSRHDFGLFLSQEMSLH